jgi:tetratricopeptide (TPR) repeat protein
MKTGILKFFCLGIFLLFSSKNVLAVDITNEWRQAVYDSNQHDFASALSHFNRALAADTNNLLTLMSRGGCYMQLGKFTEAEKDYDLAVKSSTNNLTLAQALFYRGNFYSQTTNLDRALDDYSKAIQYNPASSPVYATRANVEIQTGDYNGTMQDCNMAIMLNPDLVQAYEIRGRIFFQKGLQEKAIDDYTKAICLDSNNPTYYYLRGMAFGQKDDDKSAVKDFSRAIQAAGDNYSPVSVAIFYSGRGFFSSKIGQFEKGIEDCKKSLEFATNSDMCFNNLAWLLSVAPDAKLRNGKLAVEYATRACELSDWKNAYDVGTLAAAYAETGNFDEAVNWEKKAILIGFPLKENEQAHRELDLFEQKQPFHAKK